jgi:hypothetical protein
MNHVAVCRHFLYGLIFLLFLASEASAQICCASGCVQDGNRCVTIGANPTACATVPCPGGGSGPGGGGPGVGHGGRTPVWVPNEGPSCYVDQPPRGSYQRSCENIVWDCKMLKATCKTRAGAKVATTLVPGGCVPFGDIANMDGTLHCNMGGPLPNGSYSQSCRDMWIAMGTLNAQCKDRGGNWHKSSPLTVASCRNGIDNIDGTLQCH